ncbi:glycerophosphodiester phosphodiesterase family protein [Halobacteriovorax sp. GB3]|uniref:glycerophosphodiester phosphodiesterase family protein n=1 Tax=Halobacteriovorax sp. GB3 TaxID=2719615 RepID=UPI002360D4A3|nr:glycerophosphodiester phosphodiesterase family protein [Halobacteriovorax sp. GB3]MDD0852088.1 glycerophosphodiester phosphodiesterase family protein [Halobacteriovorax sp. GB3]
MREAFIDRLAIAHRGLHRDGIPENTLGAFEQAIKYGYAIEIDVHLSADKEVVVFHDQTLKRAANRDIAVEKTAYSEFRDIEIFNSKATIPTLQEVLDLVDTQVPLVIELKTYDLSIELAQRVYQILSHYEGKVAIQSFNPIPLIWLRQQSRDLCLGVLTGSLDGAVLPWYKWLTLKYMILCPLVRPDYFGLEYRKTNRFQELIASSFYQRPIVNWVICDESEREDSLNQGRNIIFENFLPEKLSY